MCCEVRTASLATDRFCFETLETRALVLLDADIQPLSALHNLTELNLNHVESVKRVAGLYSLTTLRAIHVGYSDADRQFVHDLSMQFHLLQLLDVAYSRHELLPERFQNIKYSAQASSRYAAKYNGLPLIFAGISRTRARATHSGASAGSPA